MGAVNANMFSVAKLCVAAAQRAYFPTILANLHCSTARDEASYFRRTLSRPLQLPVLVFAKLTRRLRWEHSVPVYVSLGSLDVCLGHTRSPFRANSSDRFALLLNGILTSLFILAGSLTGLITLIGIHPYNLS